MWGIPVDTEALIVAIAVGVFFISRYSGWKPGNLALALTHFTIVYLLWVVSAFIYDAYIDYKVATFDVDGDGMFSNDEVLPEEYYKYHNIQISDALRNLAPIFGFVCALFWSSIFFLVLSWLEQIKHKKPAG